MTGVSFGVNVLYLFVLVNGSTGTSGAERLPYVPHFACEPTLVHLHLKEMEFSRFIVETSIIFTSMYFRNMLCVHVYIPIMPKRAIKQGQGKSLE